MERKKEMGKGKDERGRVGWRLYVDKEFIFSYIFDIR
jgi:hypothetical protein